jgi:serine/threonine-protein kinase
MSVSVGAHPMVGAVLSARYRLLGLLGEGGMGAVFEAQDLQGHGRYAIKVLHPEYAKNEHVLARFYAEGEATARLVHPNIARCFGYAQAEDRSPYIIMELLDGSSLTSYLKPGLAYDAQYAVPIVRGLLGALAEAHRQGIIHRDIKPDNVYLVRNPSGPPIVKVLDFGIAKVMDSAGGMMSKTRTGMLLGTPAYMSPEQIRDAKTVDARADLWSAGIILYELLTGREAFAAPTELAKLTAILSGSPLPIDQGKPQLSPWRGFFAKALAREPDARFSTAAEMEAAMTSTDHAARASGAPVTAPASTTDMSPELPKGIASHVTAPPQVQVQVIAPPSAPARELPGPTSDGTLKAGEMPMLAAPGTQVALWVLFVVALLSLGAGFAVGFVVAKL